MKPNETVVGDDAAAYQCKSCGGKQGKPMGVTEQEYNGIHNGVEYNKIIRTRTMCLKCNQFSIERSYQ